MDRRHFTPVDEYDSQNEGLFDYPGRRPEYSYITDGEEIVGLPDGMPESIASIDSYLQGEGLPGLDERVAVLAYGANANPAKLRKKMSGYGDEQMQRELQTVPCVFTDIPDVDVVWHGRPCQKGAHFAELIAAEGNSVKAGILFLTKKQLLAIHATEGVTYDYALLDYLPIEVSGKKMEIPLTAYVASEASVAVDDEGKPISVAGVTRQGGEPTATLTCKEMTQRVLEAPGIRELLGRSVDADAFYEEGEAMTLKERRERQGLVGAALLAEGLSREHEYTEVKDIYPPAATSDLPYAGGQQHYSGGAQDIEILEDVMKDMRKGERDIVPKIRARAHQKLEQRLDKETGPV